ncbi:MAG: N-acetylmuramoyl-L-alanine amidase-like domain-containing protein [Patescibacteria group bacterium]
MNKKIIALIVVLILVLGFAIFREKPEEVEEPTITEKEQTENYDELREIITGFIGTPYELGPLDEGENVYREDVFDCTTLVLVSVANLHSDSPEEEIKDINYYPAGEVSYENRLHFSTYRNKVSDYFEDITSEVGGDYVKQKEVMLNKDRLIDIGWEKSITIDYLSVEDSLQVLDNLPEVAGIMFMKNGNGDIGLDINHEGFVLDGEDLVHASPNHGQVYREDLKGYLQNSDFDSVAFYKVK